MFKVIPIQINNLKGLKEADILEVWFDRIPPEFHKKIISNIIKRKKPIIYKLENIKLQSIENKISGKNLNANLIKESSYIDVDISAKKPLILKIKKLNPKIKIIVSYHNFKETPYEKELNKIFEKMTVLKADIVKFATQAKDISDSFRMIDFLQDLNRRGFKAICLCMGKHGLLTRLTGEIFGNYLMYFAADRQKASASASASASGQITLKEYKSYIHGT